jgi:hypothetical protein
VTMTSLTFSSAFGTRTAVGALLLDALISEDTVLDSYASSYPVEDGSTITDHIANEAERLSLSGQITSADITLFGQGGWQKLVQAKDVLRQLHEARVPITISTVLDTYSEMVMERCRIGRSNEGDHFTVDCDFRRITKAELRTEAVPEDRVAPKAKGKAGASRRSGGKASTQSVGASSQTDATRYVSNVVGGSGKG